MAKHINKSSLNLNKQIGIKQIYLQPRMDTNDANCVLETIKGAISEIYNQNASSLSFEELYRKAYDMVLHKHGNKLYVGVKTEILIHLGNFREKIVASTDDGFLSTLIFYWGVHISSIKMIADILMYMDRRYAATEGFPRVYLLGVQLFREQALYQDLINTRLLKALLLTIDSERKGELVNRENLRNAIQMLVDLGSDVSENKLSVYQENFEKKFIEVGLFMLRNWS